MEWDLDQRGRPAPSALLPCASSYAGSGVRTALLTPLWSIDDVGSSIGGVTGARATVPNSSGGSGQHAVASWASPVSARAEEPMEYRSVRIKDVIDGINKDYFLPAIQRELVWEPAQIEKLFDSNLGDYPIGSFLFWKVEERNKEQWTTFEFISQFDQAYPHNPEADLN